jgi:hypothetical protein
MAHFVTRRPFEVRVLTGTGAEVEVEFADAGAGAAVEGDLDLLLGMSFSVFGDVRARGVLEPSVLASGIELVAAESPPIWKRLGVRTFRSGPCR